MSALFSKKNREVLLTPLGLNNPVTVQVLGICSALAVTAQLEPAIVMGLSVTVITAFSNVVISLIKNLIPDMVRIPSFIVVIASFVTLLQMVMQAYVPGLFATLGLFIPLIVVNCIVLDVPKPSLPRITQLLLCSTVSVWGLALPSP